MLKKKIKDSVEWTPIEDYLNEKSFGLKHEREIKKMIRNLRNNVAELSKAEVEMRRGRTNKAAALLDNINNDIELVEEYILVAALIG
jgi:hypothetical protein